MRPPDNPTGDLNAILSPKDCRLVANRLGCVFRRENHLHNAAAVPQMDKEHLPVISESVDPAGKGDIAADIGKAQMPAIESIMVWHYG